MWCWRMCAGMTAQTGVYAGASSWRHDCSRGDITPRILTGEKLATATPSPGEAGTPDGDERSH
ncbi:hypothetical protein KCP73_11435 [Salmonella enterica subsp. enterica]|nr:hypothetical protein KCP73_11435 [Salmonella enterica subsp. enterica]